MRSRNRKNSAVGLPWAVGFVIIAGSLSAAPPVSWAVGDDKGGI